MTRDEYIKHRNENQIPIQLAYQFYVETPHHLPKVDLHVFVPLFHQWIMFGGFGKFFAHYDVKYGITKMTNSKTNTTKYY